MRVGEVDGEEVVGDVGVVVLRGDWAVGSVETWRVEEFEKTVRSFWRERAGERRWDGMVVLFLFGVVWFGVEMVVFGVIWRWYG